MSGIFWIDLRSLQKSYNPHWYGVRIKGIWRLHCTYLSCSDVPSELKRVVTVSVTIENDN